MKTKLIALALLTITGIAVTTWPHYADAFRAAPQPQDPIDVTVNPTQTKKIQVVFVLDTTGSMSGLISTAKQKIWSIASSMASAQNAPEIEIGLVAYRDRGDAYVTRVTDLSADLDSVYATLMDFQADGGGDTPESVNAALSAAIDQISWDQNQNTYQVVFLVGDAPPHMDYPGEQQFPALARRAASRNIVLNAIRCGNNDNTAQHWQQIASLGHGSYFTVDQDAQALAIATPFDDELAKLSAQLDETRLTFGDDKTLAAAKAKVAATEKVHVTASVATRARRASFNALASGKKNLYGENDLIDAISTGEVTMADVDEASLPEPLRDMTVAQRQEIVEAKQEARSKLDGRIQKLVTKRSDYISAKAAVIPEAEESLEYQIFETVKEQAAKIGLSYTDDAPQL